MLRLASGAHPTIGATTMASPTQSSAVAPSFPPDDLHPAELGQPLRRKYGRMTPLCSACGRQWLLAPMWGMNLVTLALVLVPGWLWFVKVAPERSSFEQFILAPALFLGTLTAYALTSWVDPGIVQPGRFAALEARLRQAAVSARSDGGEALETPQECLRTRWAHVPGSSLARRTMATLDGEVVHVCEICGVPQPQEHMVSHVT